MQTNTEEISPVVWGFTKQTWHTVQDVVTKKYAWVLMETNTVTSTWFDTAEDAEKWRPSHNDMYE